MTTSLHEYNTNDKSLLIFSLKNDGALYKARKIFIKIESHSSYFQADFAVKIRGVGIGACVMAPLVVSPPVRLLFSTVTPILLTSADKEEA